MVGEIFGYYNKLVHKGGDISSDGPVALKLLALHLVGACRRCGRRSTKTQI